MPDTSKLRYLFQCKLPHSISSSAPKGDRTGNALHPFSYISANSLHNHSAREHSTQSLIGHCAPECGSRSLSFAVCRSQKLIAVAGLSVGHLTPPPRGGGRVSVLVGNLFARPERNCYSLPKQCPAVTVASLLGRLFLCSQHLATATLHGGGAFGLPCTAVGSRFARNK